MKDQSIIFFFLKNTSRKRFHLKQINKKAMYFMTYKDLEDYAVLILILNFFKKILVLRNSRFWVMEILKKSTVQQG